MCGYSKSAKGDFSVKLIYVAAPYRAETKQAVARNIEAAKHVGQLMARKGWMPVMPTANTGLFDFDYPSLQDDDFWLDGTLELMRRCDAVVLTPGWEDSKGCLNEIRVARELGMKVWHPHEVSEPGPCLSVA